MQRKNMKIRVDDSNRQAVRDALEALRYNLAGVSNDAPYYYTYENTRDVNYGMYDSTFLQKPVEEHFLVKGEFVTKDYWTYPETTYEPLPVEEPSAPTITPRVEFLRQRVSEILAAMTRFNDLKMVPPSEWHLELEDIFEEIKNA